MATYRYKAKTAEGKIQNGKIQASDEQSFYKELEKRELFCISFKELGAAGANETIGKLSLKQLNIFCRELGVMLEAGVPMIDVLTTMHRRCKEPKLKKCYMKLMEQIETGSSLADAMRKMEGTFPKILIAMVEVGEQSGSLDTVVTDMSDFYGKEHATRSKMQTMMIYPVMLLVVTFFVVIIVFTFVLPKFFDMFVGNDLPWITKAMIAFSNFLINDWEFILLGAAALIIFFIVFSKTPTGRYAIDKALCNIPMVSKLMEKTVISRFANTMSILQGNGIAVLESIEICSGTLGNVYRQERLTRIREEVEKGIPFSESMEKEGLFEDMVWSMMATGEETGRSAEMYQKLYAYYSQESDIATGKLMALMEPIIMIIIGLIIGAVLFSVLVPIYSIYGS